MSPLHRNLGIPRNRTEDREGLSRAGRPGRGQLGHSRGWQDIEGNHTHSAIHFETQQKPQTRGQEVYGSSSSGPPTPQSPFSIDHGQKEVQPSITLGRICSNLPKDMSQRDRLQRPFGNHQRRTADPDRAYSDSFRLTRSRPNQLSSGFTSFRHHQISGKESPLFTIPGRFEEKTRIQRQKQDFFQPRAERVRTNDPEAVGLCERSTQEPEIAVHTSRISSCNNRNITPTQNEHGVSTPESKLNIMQSKLKSSLQSSKEAMRG
ncbi:hypothetical protein O181_032494 [Austropuccinia psidii MF-1]|uniref:Uncharacterized protein n=1 Tax=Austropuccinia psidii MF-1 TaxID=1389203 RepID=A0A9Q3CWX0_9BASI|nr:hypothetical protein [Austropuccinia psidii MF-1]